MHSCSTIANMIVEVSEWKCSCGQSRCLLLAGSTTRRLLLPLLLALSAAAVDRLNTSASILLAVSQLHKRKRLDHGAKRPSSSVCRRRCGPPSDRFLLAPTLCRCRRQLRVWSSFYLAAFRRWLPSRSQSRWVRVWSKLSTAVCVA